MDALQQKIALNEPIDRPRLTQRFVDGLHHKLTLVEAPLGYGKTTLIRSWIDLLRGRGTPTEYISFEGTEHDSTRLLLQGLVRFGATVGFDDDPQPATSKAEAYAPEAQSLVENVAGLRRRCCLILDDFHEANQTCRQLVQSLLRQETDTLHLIIGTREHPGFPLTKLRMANKVTDFGLSDLRFDADEAAALFRGELSHEDVQTYLGRAEGWVAALHLLRQFGLRGQGTPPDFDQLSEFADYLNEQYFEQLAAPQQELLVRTAHVARVNGDLADHLTGKSDGWTQLSQLAAAHALIFEETDDGTPTYRYHQLLRDFLVARQRLMGEERLSALHAATSDWFRDRNDLVPAMRHACAAGQEDRAAQMLLDAGGVQFGMLRGAARLELCLDLLSATTIYETPRLLVARAYLFLKSGRIRDAADILRDVRAALGPDDRIFEREIILVEAHLRIYEDTPLSPRQTEALEHTIASTPATDPLMRGLLNNFLCMFLIEQGEFEKGLDTADSAMAFYRDIGADHLQFFMYLHISTILLEKGEVTKARALRDRAAEICVEQFSFDPSLRAISDVYQCEIAFEMGEIEGLTDRLVAALARIDRHEGWNMLYLAGYETCLGLMVSASAFEDAAELLENAGNMVVRRGIRLFGNQLRIMELDLAVQAGAHREADRLAQEVYRLRETRDVNMALRWRGRIRADLALARYEASTDRQSAARERLSRVAETCSAKGYERQYLRALVRKLVLEAQMQDAKAAEATLRTYLSKVADRNNFGAVMREPAEFAAAANWVVTECGLGRFDTGEIQLLAECLWRASGKPADRSANIMAELLTAKELEVLAELTKGHANKVIARNLQVSEPTVKFHLQNVYRKTGVNSRKLAIELAQKFGAHRSDAA